MSNVGKDVVDDCGVGDITNDAQCSAAERAYGDIELERPLESLCPGQLCGFGRFWLACPVLKIRGGGLRGAFFAGFARHDLSPQGAVWCKHAVVSG